MPYADEAKRFKDRKLSSGTLKVVAVEGIESRVLSEIARDLGQFHVESPIGELIFGDVSTAFRRMTEIDVLTLVSQSLLLRPAFLIAVYYDGLFSDALAVALSEHTGYPLLIADQETYSMLTGVAPERPGFRAVWIGDYEFV